MLPTAVLMGCAAVVLVRAVRVALHALAGDSFETDAWVWVFAARKPWSELIAFEWASTDERLRPITHFLFYAYVKLFGTDAQRLAYFFFGLVAALHGLLVVLARRLGLRLETGLIASLLVFLSRPVWDTYLALQYNDVVLASFFSLAAISVSLGRDRESRAPDAARNGGSAWVAAPLALLAVGAHECGGLCGPLLVLAYLYRDGVRSVRAWALRPSTLSLAGIFVVYATWRFMTVRTSANGFIGTTRIGDNLLHLWQVIRSEAIDRHGPSIVALERAPLIAGAVVLVVAAAWLRPGQKELSSLVRLTLFAPLWAITAYAPFLLNQAYQSSTYSIVSLFGPCLWSAALVTWVLLSPPRSRSSEMPRVRALVSVLRAVAAGALVLLVVGAPAVYAGSPPRHASRRLLQAIAERRAQHPSRCLDVWSLSAPAEHNQYGQTFVEDTLMGSTAVWATYPDRSVNIHHLDAALMRLVRPRPFDPILETEDALDENGSAQPRVWLLEGHLWERLIGPRTTYGPAFPVAGEAPAAATLRDRAGQPMAATEAAEVRAIIDDFWRGYGDCDHERQCHAMRGLHAHLDEEQVHDRRETAPPWLRAIQACEVDCGF